MNVFKRLYARTVEGLIVLAKPFMPYTDPQILESVEAIPDALKAHGKKRPIIVTGNTVITLDFTKGLLGALERAGVEYSIYHNVTPNPTTDEVEEAKTKYLQDGCDSIIAIGGGSPLDCAKALGARIARPEKSVSQMKGVMKVRKAIPFLVAVPTTAGSGSEVSIAAVITDAHTHHKYAISDFSLIPRCAVLDAGATASLPPHTIAGTGMDALTHALEAYMGRSTTKSTRKDALNAIKLIFENLYENYSECSEQSRKNMLMASHMAGRAFNKSYVGYVHALAHALGGKYNCPHGITNAILLVPVIEAYGKCVHKKLNKVAIFCGFAPKGSKSAHGAAVLIERIKKLNDSLGIPHTMPQIKKEDIAALADTAYREVYPLYPVPVLWTRKQIENVYLKVCL